MSTMQYDKQIRKNVSDAVAEDIYALFESISDQCNRHGRYSLDVKVRLTCAAFNQQQARIAATLSELMERGI